MLLLQTFWDDDILSDEDLQAMMIYNFDYLPSGLFNRAQVRLQQYSDESKLWRDGSLLRKNIHRGIVRQKELA